MIKNLLDSYRLASAVFPFTKGPERWIGLERRPTNDFEREDEK